MKQTFICSDIHFQHRNILQYCPHRIDSSFTSDIKLASPEEIDDLVLKMNEKIISNWNSKVKPEDEVFCLGDIALGQIINAPLLIRRLNGKKYLVKGNHDRTLVKLINSDFNQYGDLFDWIKDYHEFGFVLPNGKKQMICMSHYPMRFWNGKHQSSMMLSGHLHGSYCDVPGRIADVGLDTNDLFPYLMIDVVTKLLDIVDEEHHH